MQQARTLALRLVALAIAVVAIVYFVTVVRRLYAESGAAAFAEPALWTAIGVAAVLSLLTQGIAAFAYRAMVAGFGRAISHRESIATVLTAQFAKYVPGNVGPWIGRPILAQRFGVPVSTTVRTLVHESLLTIAVGGLIGLLLTAPRLLGNDVDGDRQLVALIAALTIGVLVATAVVPTIERLLARWPRFRVPDAMPLSRRLQLGLAGLYGANFVLAGVSLLVIARALGIDASLALMTGAFALAWVAGFVVPGPPAGLGVREAVLIALTHGAIDATSAAQLVIAHRIATTLADLAAFALGAWLLRRPQ